MVEEAQKPVRVEREVEREVWVWDRGDLVRDRKAEKGGSLGGGTGNWARKGKLTIVGPLDVTVVVDLGGKRQEHPLETRDAG